MSKHRRLRWWDSIPEGFYERVKALPVKPGFVRCVCHGRELLAEPSWRGLTRRR